MAASNLTFSGFSITNYSPKKGANTELTKHLCFALRSQNNSKPQNEGRGRKRVWRRRKLYLYGSLVQQSFPIHRLGRIFAATDQVDVKEELRENCSGSDNMNRTSTNVLDDLEGQLQDLFDEVNSMIKMGKKKDARNLLVANYEILKEAIDAGARSTEQAAILDVIALGHMALGDLKTLSFMLDMLNNVVNGLADDEPHLDSILVHMGSMYSHLENFDMSISSYGRAVEIIQRMYENSNPLLAMPLLGMAKALESTGKSNEAIATYDRVIRILESSRGAGSEELAVPLLGLGNLLVKEGKTTDAEKAFDRILDIYMELYGKNDGRVGLAMSSLARVKHAKEDKKGGRFWRSACLSPRSTKGKNIQAQPLIS